MRPRFTWPVRARLQERRLLGRGLVLGVCLEVAPPARERARAGRALDDVAPRPPSDTGTLVMVRARPPPPARRVAVLEATPAPETTVAMPPRTARAPSDAPAPAALPPMLAPASTADPIVRTTASAGLLTTAGVFSCQTRTPYPATAPSNPATTHSSISAPPPESHHTGPLLRGSGRIAPRLRCSGITRIGGNRPSSATSRCPTCPTLSGVWDPDSDPVELYYLPDEAARSQARSVARPTNARPTMARPSASLSIVRLAPHREGPGLLSEPGSDCRQPRGRQAFTTLATAVTRNNWPVRASSTARLWPGLVAGTRLP